MFEGVFIPYSALAVIAVLVSTIYFFLFFNRNRAGAQKRSIIATTSQSVGPFARGTDPEMAAAEKVATSSEKVSAPKDVSIPPSSPPSASTQRKLSITALITNILPSRRGSFASPLTATTETPVGERELPVVNRSKEEIESYGDFPDYSALSGVRLPEPYVEFNIEKALPRPYRPFRWSYHQTMAFRKMEPDWWLELENTYIDRVHQRKELFAKHGKAVLDSLPGSEAACKETMEMCLQFLVARYPQYFSLVTENPTAAASPPDIFVNGILHKEFRISEMDPLMVLLENVPEDFAITLQDVDTGLYVFKAGVICSSLGWNLGTKLGMTLSDVHAHVPDYKEKLKFSMDRYFTRIMTNAPIQRGSWGLEVGEPLFMPPGDPHELHRLSQNPQLTASDIKLRVDWQTLRRLPLSGSVVFNYKALFTPISEFRDEPGVPQIVAKILREGKKNLMEYKSTWHVEHVALPLLDKWSEEQVEHGLVEKEWEVATLEENPLFKGWREKWKRQQGF